MPQSFRSRCARISRRAAVIIGGTLLILGIALGVWISGLAEPPSVDQLWERLMTQTLVPIGVAIAQVMNWLGGGWFAVYAVPLGGAALLITSRRPWGALYLVTASAVSALVVQVLKKTMDRPRQEDIMVVADYGSFPSGHVANAITLAVVLWVLFPRVWVAISMTAWVVLMAWSRTYLHAHWLSDTIGGMLIGTGVALVVAAAFGPTRVRRRRLAVAKSPPIG